MEIDISDAKPLKFWLGLLGFWLVGSGGAGGASYALAQQATEQTAREVARKEARSEVESVGKEVERIRSQVEANTRTSAEYAADVKWIRDTLQKIEQRQYDNRGGNRDGS